MLNSELLLILRCPETRQVVALADAALIHTLNQQIAAGQLRNRAGKVITEKIDGGLVRADQQMLYPIRHDLPILLIDEAISLAAIDTVASEWKKP